MFKRLSRAIAELLRESSEHIPIEAEAQIQDISMKDGKITIKLLFQVLDEKE